MSRRYQARGLERRQALIDACRELLQVTDLSDLSFAMIAARAEVPESSAYHFFPNRQAVFEVVAMETGEVFAAAVESAASGTWDSWQPLVEAQIDACLQVYADNPVFRRLLVGLSAQPDTYTIESQGNLVLAERWLKTLTSHFVLPTPELFQGRLSIMIECVDAIIRLSIVEHGEIAPAMRLECKRLGVAYLGVYLPRVLPVTS